jgi:hypothetical protein
MIVSIIENCDLPDKAEFMVDEKGDRLIFRTHDSAETYLAENAGNGVYYKHYDGED